MRGPEARSLSTMPVGIDRALTSRSNTVSVSPRRMALLGKAERRSVTASMVSASQRSSTSRARSSRNASRVTEAAARVTARATLESA